MSRNAASYRSNRPVDRTAEPPALARWLLRRVCADSCLEAVSGDVEELFRLRLRTEGWLRAALRCFADVFSIAVTGPRHPVRSQHSKSFIPEVIVGTLLQDLRFAVRGLTKSPAFAAVVILTLGLGIGANTTIFSVVNGVLLQPLPYPDPDRIVQIAETDPEMEMERNSSMASQRLFLAWRESGRAFSDMAMYSEQAATLTGRDEPIRLTGSAVSPTLFRLLGVDAAVGRTFTGDEETPGNDNVILLSSRAWQRYFGGDPDLVGQQLRLDDRSRTVVGIMPPAFDFPDPSVEYWVPMIVQPLGAGGDGALEQQASQQIREEREVRRGGPGGGGGRPDDGSGPGPEVHIELWSRMVGRLADGMELGPAVEEGTSILRATRTWTGPDDGAYVDLIVLQDELVGPVRSSLNLLMGAVGFVLLIACANVANLMLARSAGRSKETALRSALGAGKLQLIRLLLVEGLVLAGIGGALGLALTAVGLGFLRSIGADFIPRLQNATLDAWALGFTVAVSMLTGILFSLMPARGAAALNLTRALKQEGPSDGAARTLGGDVFRKVLVTVEVALSVILLVGAGLLVSSFVRLAAVDPGYDPENVLSVSLQMPQTRYANADAYRNFFDESIAALELIPGIEGVTLASVPPTREANVRIAIAISNDPERPDVPPTTFGIRVVETSYFETMRMGLVEGRFFTRDDRAGGIPVAVVNESAARAIFPDDEPVGRSFPFMGGQELEIIGIVADVRTAGVDPRSSPEVFLPLNQAPARLIPALFRSSSFLIRTTPAPLTILPAVRSRMVQIDPEVPLFRAATMRDQIADSVAEPRFYAALVSAFAGLAVALAAVGIYGLLSYSVQQGVRETAIRRALGAQAGEILQQVVGRGMALAVVGLIVGIAGSLALTRLLESMLYEIEPTDPATLIIATLVFLLVALMAIWVPARRATKIDPMEALR
ncbi:MAG: ABC transporter permease [Acidobacteria bacterium]|nr:ABC transporter permease [Acidobacteriota bacterium]